LRIIDKFSLFLRLLRLVRNWPIYFFNRFGFIRTGTVTYKLRNGIKISSRPFSIDRSALNDVWLEESYSPSHCGIKWDWAGCKTIIDIGANIGTFTLYAAINAPGATVYAMEPEPGNYGMLIQNIRQNGLSKRVTTLQAAMSGAAGNAILHISPHVSGGHSLFKHSSTGADAVTVNIMTLGDLLSEKKIDVCDFLKLDCEGAEYEILYSLPAETLNKIRCIAVECHLFSGNPLHRPEKLKMFLEEKGFDVRPLKKSMYLATRAADLSLR